MHKFEEYINSCGQIKVDNYTFKVDGMGYWLFTPTETVLFNSVHNMYDYMKRNRIPIEFDWKTGQPIYSKFLADLQENEGEWFCVDDYEFKYDDNYVFVDDGYTLKCLNTKEFVEYMNSPMFPLDIDPLTGKPVSTVDVVGNREKDFWLAYNRNDCGSENILLKAFDREEAERMALEYFRCEEVGVYKFSKTNMANIWSDKEG